MIDPISESVKNNINLPNLSKEVLINLDRQDGNFGFNIIGGIDQPFCPGLGGVFISKIKKNGPAEKSGNLHVGDLIKEVNGQDVSKKTHMEVADIFRAVGSNVSLLIQQKAEADYLSKPADMFIQRATEKLEAHKKDNSNLNDETVDSLNLSSQTSAFVTAPNTPHVKSVNTDKNPAILDFKDEILCKDIISEDESQSNCSEEIFLHVDTTVNSKQSKRFLDPLNPSIWPELLFLSIGITALGLTIFFGHRYYSRNR